MIKEIKFTDKAIKQINHLLSQKDKGSFFRIAIKGGGCSGFSYLLDLTETKAEGDEQWDFDFEIDGDPFTLMVICDPKSYLYLNGTTVDFKDEVMGRGFVFDNPNASSSCGCGSSFST